MSLDPELQEILDGWAALEGPPAHEVPVDQARRAHLSETEHLAGEGPAVARVSDDTAAGVPIRVYEPEHARGTVAYLHGGGWVLGNLESVDAVCRAVANEANARVVSIDYRLAPEHPFPAALDDALNATRAVEADVVAGDSAGGNLAAVVARHLKTQLKLQLLIYPVTDAGINTPSYRELDERFGLTAAAMRRFWNLYLDGADGFAPDASPLRADDLSGLPPAYILTASHDVLRDEGEAYAGALERAGVPVTLNRKAGTIHGFWRWQTKAISREAVREAGAAIRAVLG
ncbi:alpha/beta hydrolase [Solirubrobacter ginsenosidimutans]|uniref:Alpha/beta hydrolase n=1 Tax=Solirubrobacter ginsenosidimutans TaxID=490573 RepID=A0A9X3N1E0_9ACTN|nr:alpha/beta hydrolase [Solirubrobacter ginsenosidimutans]MDA0165288.1 alpha/beta hydrolase [Solirubrobacter ginsenosidimutans]